MRKHDKTSSFFLFLKVAIAFCVVALPFIIGYAIATVGETVENRKA